MCTGYKCVYRLQVCVQVTSVCTGYKCVYRLQVCVQVTSVCTGYKCVYKQTSVAVDMKFSLSYVVNQYVVMINYSS